MPDCGCLKGGHHFLKNEQEITLEILDGMPALIPYGVDADSMKNMTQTAKAWMQAEELNRELCGGILRLTRRQGT